MMSLGFCHIVPLELTGKVVTPPDARMDRLSTCLPVPARSWLTFFFHPPVLERHAQLPYLPDYPNPPHMTTLLTGSFFLLSGYEPDYLRRTSKQRRQMHATELTTKQELL